MVIFILAALLAQHCMYCVAYVIFSKNGKI